VALFDTHCHLTDPAFAPDLAAVLARAAAAGVDRILSVSVNLATAGGALDQAKIHSGILAAVGVHPEEAGNVAPGWEAALERLIADGRPAAVGECGLDAHHPVPTIEIQRPVFVAQLRLAKKYALPLVMHTRKAGWEVLKLLESEGLPPHGVFHCIEDDELLVRAVTKAGWHVGFGGTCTYPRNQPLREILSRVDRSRVILETDAPYLAPQPVRGKRNEPALIVHAAAVAGRAWGITAEEAAALTTANALRLFAAHAEANPAKD